jgi:hypothetical protein
MNMAGMAGLAGDPSTGCDGTGAAFSGLVVWAWTAIALNANNTRIKPRHEMQIQFFGNILKLCYCGADAPGCGLVRIFASFGGTGLQPV